VNLVNTTTPASNRPTLRREPLLHLTILVEEGLDGTIDSELIDTHELTVARGLRESPTVLIDGVNPFAAEYSPPGVGWEPYDRTRGALGKWPDSPPLGGTSPLPRPTRGDVTRAGGRAERFTVGPAKGKRSRIPSPTVCVRHAIS
jgi:hypothetical protein